MERFVMTPGQMRNKAVVLTGTTMREAEPVLMLC